MASILIRFLFMIVALWLLRRFLGSLFGGARQASPKNNQPVATNNMVKDPVCGMYMDSRLAVRLENRKEDYYFCSEECRKKYLGKPGPGTETPNASSL
jgi:uncharacterized protein